MNKKSNFTRDQTGDGYIDIAIVIIIVFLLLATLLTLFPVISAQQSLNNTARQIARTIEITGSAGGEIETQLNDLASIRPDEMNVDTIWHDSAVKTIQLKTPFTVTVKKKVTLTIFRPALGDPLVFEVEISAEASGISEVYYK